MKPGKISKKLQIKKVTITDLSKMQMIGVCGGGCVELTINCSVDVYTCEQACSDATHCVY